MLTFKSEQAEKVPRISVNKLAEYMGANPHRRKQIIYDAKYPEAFKTTRYGDSKPVILDFICGRIDTGEVLIQQSKIRDYEAKGDFEINDQKNSIESLSWLLKADLSPLKDCIINSYSDNIIVNINGLNISVNPDLMVEKLVKGVINKGAIKLAIAKSALTKDAQLVVAVMIWRYTNDYLLKSNEFVNTKLCFSYDVFNKSLCFCPASYKTRLKHIEHACEEIAVRWPTINR